MIPVKRLAFAAVLSSLAFAPSGHAVSNRLKVVGPASVNLEMGVDWDFDNPPAGAADREYLTSALRAFAETTYRATEGRLRICKVYVRNKRHLFDSTDIALSQASDRAHAALGALRSQSGQMHLFLRKSDVSRPSGELGRTMAHEFGHYGLSLRDEYTEALEAGKAQEYESPRVCDVTLPTLMGETYNSDGFSLPATYTAATYAPWSATASGLTKEQKYQSCVPLTAPGAGETQREDATWRTAHWRTYKRSAWEVMALPPPREPIPAELRDLPRAAQFENIVKDGVPGALAPPPFDGQCFEAIFLSGAYVVIAIDRSQSMSGLTGEADQTYLDKALFNAKQYVDSAPAGTTLAVIQYSSDITLVVPPTKLEESSLVAQRTQINATIDGLNQSGGNTGLDAALDQAWNLLVEGADVGNYQYVLAYTDGEVLVSEWLLGKYLGTVIPIFGFAAGPKSGLENLKTLFQRTRGDARGLAAWTYDAIAKILERNERLSIRMFPKPGAKEPLESPVEVSELEGHTSFRAHWASGDTAAFELVTPEGAVLTPATLPAGVSYESDSIGGTYVVSKPAAGVWKPRVVPQSVPSGDVHLEVSSASTLGLQVEATGGAAYPEPWLVRALLSGTAPVLGAQVTGTLRRQPGGAASEIAFRDDGVPPDVDADDGLYTAIIATVVDNGEYSLDVRATNPGAARVDSSGVADEPGDSPPPQPLSAFTREASLELEAKGYHSMPTSPAEALQVRNDLTPIWVTLDQPGDVVWLQFNGYKKGHYVAMTGALVSNDTQPMTTRLTLYDTDGATELASDAKEDGRAWVELDTPNVDGKYYLKVEHTQGGVGRFQVAVAPREWLEASGTSKAEGDEACSCRAPGSGTLRPRAAVLFALGTALLYARRRRRRTSAAD